MTSERKVNRAEALAAVRTLLAYMGEDPAREGLAQTPHRFLKAWETDWGTGYDPNGKPELTTFDAETYNRNAGGAADLHQPFVLVRNIRFHSHCEHHIAPFFGVADVAYIPRARIVGLSKLARVVHHFSRRLQVQERLCDQVADYLMDRLSPHGVAVRMEAVHTCMLTRGVHEPESTTLTTSLRGVFFTTAEARIEFFNACTSTKRVCV